MEASLKSSGTARVSVGMPVYNEERFVAVAIDAVLAQDFKDFELVISDNASTDRTPEICQAYLAKDARVRYIRQDRNRGASFNFRHVFEQSTGEYFMWAGAHDVLLPGFISSCVRVLDEQPDVVLAYPQCVVIDRVGVPTMENVREGIDTRKRSVAARVAKIVRDLTACDMLYGLFRRPILEKCRQDLTCRGPDHVLLMELSIYGAVAQVPEVMLQLRQNRDPGEAGGSYEDYMRGQLLRLDPGAFDHGGLRPHWRWGWEHVRGVMRAEIPASTKLGLLPVAVHAFWWRWRRYLIREIFTPLAKS